MKLTVRKNDLLITDSTPADKPMGSPWTCARNSTNCGKTDLKRSPQYVPGFSIISSEI